MSTRRGRAGGVVGVSGEGRNPCCSDARLPASGGGSYAPPDPVRFPPGGDVVTRRSTKADRVVMTRQVAKQSLDELVASLDRPLSQDLKTYSWDGSIRRGLLEWCTELRGKLERGEPLTHSDLASGMARWLDVAGVTGGELVEAAARASNAVQRVIDASPASPARTRP